MTKLVCSRPTGLQVHCSLETPMFVADVERKARQSVAPVGFPVEEHRFAVSASVDLGVHA
jgi:hypothetical protein